MQEPLNPNDVRRKILLILFAIGGILSIYEFFNSFYMLDLVDRIRHGKDYSLVEAEQADLRNSLMSILQLLIYLGTAVLFIMWMYRSYLNLYKLKMNVKYAPSWAIWAWIIPIIWWFRPVQIIKDIIETNWRVIIFFKREKENEGLTSAYTRINTFIGFWWFFWLAKLIPDRIVSRAALGEGLTSMETMWNASIWAEVFSLAATIMVVIVLIRIGKLEDESFFCWKSGLVEEYRLKKEMKNNEGKENTNTWFKQENEPQEKLSDPFEKD